MKCNIPMIWASEELLIVSRCYQKSDFVLGIYSTLYQKNKTLETDVLAKVFSTVNKVYNYVKSGKI